MRRSNSHNPVGINVLDRAQVELALGSGVLGDVRNQQPVRRIGSELVPGAALAVGHRAQVIVDRRAGFLVLAALLFED